jgi:PKD repeat protein
MSKIDIFLVATRSDAGNTNGKTKWLHFSFLKKVIFWALVTLVILIIGFPSISFAAPYACFSANPTQGPAPLEVQFTDRSTPS